MAFYQVLVLEADGCELSHTEVNGLAAAKAAARVNIKDKEFLSAGADKAEVRDDAGTCVFDVFANVPRCPDCGERGARKGHMECQYPQN